MANIVENVRQKAKGKWQMIHNKLGIHYAPKGRHGPCPVCSGTDRFRFDNLEGRGTWYCNQCEPHAGDGIQLVENFLGLTLKEAAQAVEKEIQLLVNDEKAMNMNNNEVSFGRSRNREYWEMAKKDDGRIFAYLSKRGLSEKVPPTLRLNGKAKHWVDGKLEEYPAMVAKYTHDSREALGSHVTYLSKSSEGKAQVKPAKKTFRYGDRSLSGAALKLYPFDLEKPLGIAEGIENAIAVHEATQIPIWACGGANFLEKAQIPTTCRRVYIFADLDQNKVGQTSATKLAERLWQQGIRSIKVVYPPGPIPQGRKSYDFLDVLRTRGKKAITDILKKTSYWRPDFVNSMSNFQDFSCLPSIPTKVFPDCIEDFVNSLSNSTQTPRDLVAASILPVLATCLQRKVLVEVKEDHSEPLNIFTMVSLESGNRKTAVMEKLIAPLKHWDRIRLKEFEGVILNKQSKELSISGLKRSTNEIAPPRILAQDITPEKLGDLMEKNGDKLSIFWDEGGLIDILEGRYTNGKQNLDLFLKAWEGSSYWVDRKSSPSIRMDKPALTLGLMPQPIVVRNLIQNQMFRKRGLAARFLFFSPSSRLGKRSFDSEPVPKNVSLKYNKLIKALLTFRDPGLGNRIKKPLVLRLSNEAREELRMFFDKVEIELNIGGELNHISDWAGKIIGTTARIAGQLHCAEHVGSNQIEESISRGTMKRARQIGEVAIIHALATFKKNIGETSPDDASRILNWIERNGKKHFSRRECGQALKSSIKNKIDRDKAIDELVRKGKFKHLRNRTFRKRGRPSDIFEVL